MIFDKIKFVRHFVRNRVPKFDTKAVSSEVLLYRNNDWTLDQFIICVRDSTVHKGFSGCFIYAVCFVYMTEQVVARVDNLYLLP